MTFGQQLYPKLYLGKTRYTFARYGCLTDCIIMGYDFLFGAKKTPDQIVPQLQYNSDGMLLWSSLKVLGLELKEQAWHVGYLPKDMIEKWWKNQNVCCAFEINYGVHFVWQIGGWYPILGYKLFDPWTNKTSYSRYYKITGCRIFGKFQ